ncbi:methyltransferase domain containing protein [Acanthamoeba castellanii str. Neff]|uniref:Methyltransferase domain containing protein n=1 Tax=Acanthamoeba castellanii (strain ATCC 30010 / Neff) TaxID=1257118 RepID=L8HDU0_ACACF|nr:methyltransferase domain containing protein [Acanthamoeba castellanii str. Neff]ELR22928.1 methyltransferase domain containing protein [Acanthamoeba castellanii str. Neff]
MQPEQQWWAVTCGRGMERFAALEVAHKLQPISVRPTDGKLHFLLPSAAASPPAQAAPPPSSSSSSSSSSLPAPAQGDQVLSRLRGLKTAERLFVQVLAHFEEEEGGDGRNGEAAKDKSPRTIKSATGANPFKIYEHGGLFVMVGWAVSYAHLWEQAEVARLFGAQIKNKLGWYTDLKNYNTEVMIHLNDEQLVIALPVGRVPISKRSYMASFGLRPPVAWAMARLVEIGEEEVVCDPMCGAGTLLIEAAQEWPGACYVGMDVSNEQLGLCLDNLQQSRTQSRIAVCRARVEALPLRDESVDAVVCDLPFGRKFQVGDAAALARLYRAFAAEALRVLRPLGRAVLLTSQTETLEEALRAVDADGGTYCWSALSEKHYVKLGALEAWIHCVCKERTSDDDKERRRSRLREEERTRKKRKEEDRAEANDGGEQLEEKKRKKKKKKKKEKTDDDDDDDEEEEEDDEDEAARKDKDKEERRNRIFNALYFRK